MSLRSQKEYTRRCQISTTKFIQQYVLRSALWRMFITKTKTAPQRVRLVRYFCVTASRPDRLFSTDLGHSAPICQIATRHLAPRRPICPFLSVLSCPSLRVRSMRLQGSSEAGLGPLEVCAEELRSNSTRWVSHDEMECTRCNTPA